MATISRRVQVPNATSSTSGAMTAAQNNKLEGFADPGWGDLQVGRMKAACSALNNFLWLPAPLLSPTNASYGASDGGSLVVSTAWWQGTQYVLGDPSTSKWALAFCTYCNPSCDSFIGLTTVGGTKYATIGMRASSTGKLGFQLHRSTTPVPDSGTAVGASVQDLLMVYDQTALYLYKNGVLILTDSADNAQIPDQACFVGGIGTGPSAAGILDVCLGWVR